MTSRDSRRLVVLRHAKSAWPDVPDSERPLAARGRRDAPAAGRWLRETDCVPDLVVCSTACRTRETWDLVAAELGAAPAPVIYEARLYGASAAELLGVVREIPAQVRTLMLIGHNPGVQELVLSLAGEADGYVLQQTRTKFPTSAIAVLRVPGWASLESGAARLTDMVVPRGANP
ncbi:SixA phosphatase family protein [Streptomyces sp. NPDC058412]|uniref:SixA phosphatase family protein n=1 Tax=Streptomyces sp. NPDC058412 TaxID=3346486 RepID=UPI003663E520